LLAKGMLELSIIINSLNVSGGVSLPVPPRPALAASVGPSVPPPPWLRAQRQYLIASCNKEILVLFVSTFSSPERLL
jgi:hypothetical protein